MKTDLLPLLLLLLLQPAQAAAHAHLLLRSSARMVEVSVQRPSDATPTYLQTVRCTPQGDGWQGSISLQASMIPSYRPNTNMLAHAAAPTLPSSCAWDAAGLHVSWVAYLLLNLLDRPLLLLAPPGLL
jgi:hypothetical protein